MSNQKRSRFEFPFERNILVQTAKLATKSFTFDIDDSDGVRLFNIGTKKDEKHRQTNLRNASTTKDTFDKLLFCGIGYGQSSNPYEYNPVQIRRTSATQRREARKEYRRTVASAATPSTGINNDKENTVMVTSSAKVLLDALSAGETKTNLNSSAITGQTMEIGNGTEPLLDVNDVKSSVPTFLLGQQQQLSWKQQPHPVTVQNVEASRHMNVASLLDDAQKGIPAIYSNRKFILSVRVVGL